MIPTGGCALANLLAGEDPIGTATPFDQLFLIQVPSPWERIALDTPAVPAGVRQALIPAAHAKLRAYVLLIDGDAPLAPGEMRVISYRKPSGPAGPYVASEFLVPRDAAAELIRALSVRDVARAAGETDAAPEDVPTGAARGLRRLPDPSRDLYVCTHGERDGCCGTFGEAAYRYALALPRRAGTRVWRISHFGGHRFAPTLVDLPSGRVWGKLTNEALAALLARSGSVADLRAMYRGWCALHPAGQFVERELFEDRGWGWEDARVDVSVEPAGAGYRVQLDARTAGGDLLRTEAEIVEREPVALPLSCGADESIVPQYAFATDLETVSAVAAAPSR